MEIFSNRLYLMYSRARPKQISILNTVTIGKKSTVSPGDAGDRRAPPPTRTKSVTFLRYTRVHHSISRLPPPEKILYPPLVRGQKNKKNSSQAKKKPIFILLKKNLATFCFIFCNFFSFMRNTHKHM